MLKSAPLSSRGQFGQFLTERGLTGLAVEIGTHRGEFADSLLRMWPKGHLYCVDPWSCPPGYEEQTKFLWGGEDRDGDYREAQRIAARHRHRMTLLRLTSADTLKLTCTQPRGDILANLDFVYVDGDHRFPYVFEDLANWWERLKPGGVLAGHDYVQPGESHSWAAEIQRAVDLFREERQLECYLIVEEGGLPWSYFMVKPGEVK